MSNFFCVRLGKEGKLLSYFRHKKTTASSLEEVIAEAGPEFGKVLYDGTKAILIGFAEKEVLNSLLSVIN